MNTVRLQQIADDAVLEVTETVTKKTRYSETALLRTRQEIVELREKCDQRIASIDEILSTINNEKAKAK